MSDLAIRVEDLSKLYKLGVYNSGTLSEDLTRWWHKMRGKPDPLLKIGQQEAAEGFMWALKDVSFEVKKGEAVAIVGKNGAGKSTLLKILSRITAPTSGGFRVNGRIASLLEVGTGFHPELTGRENIFLNGAILGMRKAEIVRKLDEIIDFSGVSKFIDTPVKRYSSGMRVRLAFAVAAHLEPEILIVDEVLAVGDAEFQKKCLGKMQDISENSGRTVLFVSHNMSAVNRLCERSILLQKGEVASIGKTSDIVSQYLNIFSDNSVTSVTFEEKDSPVQVLEAKILHANGDEIKGSVDVSSPLRLNIRYKFRRPVNKLHLTYFIKNSSAEIVFFTDRTDYYKNFVSVSPGVYETSLVIPNPMLVPGKYALSIGCSDSESGENDHKIDVLSFEIMNLTTLRERRDGYIFMPLEWELLKQE